MKEEVKLLCWSDDETEHTRQTSIPAAAVRSTDNSEGWNDVDAMVHLLGGCWSENERYGRESSREPK